MSSRLVVCLALTLAQLWAACDSRIVNIQIGGAVDFTVRATIGPEGGRLEVTDQRNPVHGTEIIVPAGAVERDTELTVSPAVRAVAPPYLTRSLGPQVSVEFPDIAREATVILPLVIDAGEGEQVVVLRRAARGVTWEVLPASLVGDGSRRVRASIRAFGDLVVAAVPRVDGGDGGLDGGSGRDGGTGPGPAGPDHRPPVFAGLDEVGIERRASDTLEATLSWRPATDERTPAARMRYRLYLPSFGTLGVPRGESGRGQTTMTLGVTPGVSYYFLVRAVDEAGNEDSNLVIRSASSLVPGRDSGPDADVPEDVPADVPADGSSNDGSDGPGLDMASDPGGDLVADVPGDATPDAVGDAGDGAGDGTGDGGDLVDGVDGGDAGPQCALVTLCASGDGCCPAGCDYSTDTDCPYAIAPGFASSYQLRDLGAAPGVPPSYGGLAVSPFDQSRLRIGGNANSSNGAIYELGLLRDVDGHITGFAGTATLVSEGANNDGGVVFGPGNVLFLARYPLDELGQVRPGSTVTDKIIDLTPLSVVSSPGGFTFVPAGAPGAGRAKVVSWSGGQWYDLTLVDDGTGLFDATAATLLVTLTGGPEGIAYVPAGSPGFPVPSVLISEYSAGRVATYEVDATGDPVVATRRDFITNLNGAEGATIDPVSGDFLFSTFGGGDRVIVVRGFASQ